MPHTVWVSSKVSTRSFSSIFPKLNFFFLFSVALHQAMSMHVFWYLSEYGESTPENQVQRISRQCVVQH